MADENKPIVMFGDYVFGRLINLGRIIVNEKGVRVRKMIVSVQDETLFEYGISKERYGVNEKGEVGGRYIERRYPEVHIGTVRPMKVAGRNESILIVYCGFDGAENTDFLIKSEGLHQFVKNLEMER